MMTQLQPNPPDATEVRTARILVADDEARIRLVLRACLEAEGHEVFEAADGIEALDTIIRAAPDIMILDLAMPNLDGVRTLEALSGIHGHLKPRVIVLTAWGSAPAVLKTMGNGASMFLEKPIVPEALRAAIRSVLAEPADDERGIPIDWSELLRRDDERPIN